MTPYIQFFIGKGGVGKSTTSALCALQYANWNHEVLLVSMDPAHNQRDIFGMNFSEKPFRVLDHLAVREIDVESWSAKYLKDTENQIKQTYRYHSAFNLQRYFNVLRFSPGLEEYALLLAFEDILRCTSKGQVVIFDMPPTALTLRFFALPFTTHIWLAELLKLRCDIYSKKEIISKIKLGRKTIERDRVKSKLEALLTRCEQVCTLFRSGRIHINLLINEDRLSAAEALRIKKSLCAIGIQVTCLVINKTLNPDSSEALVQNLKVDRVVRFPLAGNSLAGLPALERYLSQNQDVLAPLQNIFE